MALDHQLSRQENSVVKAIKPSQSVFIDSEKIPWSPWVMEGTHFKLFRINMVTGGWTMLLKVDPGNKAPVHGHAGAAEVFIVDGEFGYEKDRGLKGWYGYEPSGAMHEPDSPNGVIMFAVIHGPIVGYNPDGGVAGVVDAKAMYNLAVEHGAAEHLDVSFEE